jgi:hypothetical protein
MQSEPEFGAPSVIVLSWTAAIAAYPAALVAAVVGQGLGALAGGCHWIGFSFSINRQVWALVNQPVLNFASLPSATGYWLGSLILPLLLAATLIPLLPRKRSLLAELVLVQVSWAASVIGIAWLPLVDRDDGHLVRWLGLHDLPAAAVWLAPFVASLLGLIPTLRLLALARRRRPDTGRLYRLRLVMVHFAAPVALWAGAAAGLGDTVPLDAMIAISFPLCAAMALAWLRYPPPFAHRLEQPSRSGLTMLIATAAACAIATTVATRPRPDGECPGVLWAAPQSFNNIRPWIDAVSLRGNLHASRGFTIRGEEIHQQIVALYSEAGRRAVHAAIPGTKITRESTS